MENLLYWKISNENGVLQALINRPDKKNSFSIAVGQELQQIIDFIKKSPDVKVFVIGSVMDDIFTAGMDVEWYITLTSKEAEDTSIFSHQLMQQLADLPVPVIAAVKGLCLTVGLELAMSCDMIYAAENANFGLVETTMGITPGGGGTQRLTQLVGPLKAKEMIFMGRVIGAEEALRVNLINAVFPLSEFDEKITRICRKLQLNSPRAVKEAKQMINLAVIESTEGYRREEIVFGENIASGEPQGRLKVFLRANRRKNRKKPKKD